MLVPYVRPHAARHPCRQACAACPSTSTASPPTATAGSRPRTATPSRPTACARSCRTACSWSASVSPAGCCRPTQARGLAPRRPPLTAATGCTSRPGRTSSCTGSRHRACRRARGSSAASGCRPGRRAGTRCATSCARRTPGVGLDEPFDCFPDARLVSDAIVARSAGAQLRAAEPGQHRLRRIARAAARTRWSTTSGSCRRCATACRATRCGPAAASARRRRSGRAARRSCPAGRAGRRRGAGRRVRRPTATFEDAGQGPHEVRGRPLGRGRLPRRVGRAVRRPRARRPPAAADGRGPRARPTASAILAAVAARRLVDRACARSGRPAWRRSRSTCRSATPTARSCELFADLADRTPTATSRSPATRTSSFRNVPLDQVPQIRAALGTTRPAPPRRRRTSPASGRARARRCAPLGITDAPDAGNALAPSPRLGRNSSLRVHVSGCPNSCAQHQIGDIGLAGSKVRIKA